MKTIDLRGVLDIVHSGAWFSIAAVQADEKRATGGKIIRLQRAKLMRRNTGSAANATAPEREAGNSKNPNHRYNFTRNLITPSNDIVTIHPLLIFEINGNHVL